MKSQNASLVFQGMFQTMKVADDDNGKGRREIKLFCK